LSYLFFRHVYQISSCFSPLPMCKICLIHLIILHWKFRMSFFPEYKLHLPRSSFCSFVLSPINNSFDIKRKETDILHRIVECILWFRYGLNYFINTNFISFILCSLQIYFKGFDVYWPVHRYDKWRRTN
jgi:hypothetical protein